MKKKKFKKKYGTLKQFINTLLRCYEDGLIDAGNFRIAICEYERDYKKCK